MPSPKPEPKETGQERPGGDKKSFSTSSHQSNEEKFCLSKGKALTLKEQDGHSNADSKASYCKHEEREKTERCDSSAQFNDLRAGVTASCLIQCIKLLGTDVNQLK